MTRLYDTVPKELRSSFRDYKSFKFRDINVVSEHTNEEWPGINHQKNVYVWWMLDNGYAVGINNNGIKKTFPLKCVVNHNRPLEYTKNGRLRQKQKKKRGGYIRLGKVSVDEVVKIKRCILTTLYQCCHIGI